MKALTIALIIFTLPNLPSHAADQEGYPEPPIEITEDSDLDKHLGKLIRVRGKVSNSKIPYISGIEVARSAKTPQDAMVEAVGVLERTIITKSDVAESIKLGILHRGVGKFYHLRQPDSNKMAVARPVR